MLRSGAIGTPRAISMERTAPPSERVPWRADPAQGGSILFDVRVHLLDLIPRLLATDIAAISALATPEPPTGHAADTITMLLRLRNGAQATLRVSRETPFAGNDLAVIGTAGMLRTGPLRWVHEHRITVTTSTGTSDEILPATGLYGAEIDGFAADIADGGERLATGEDGVHLITLTEAVRRAPLISSKSWQKAWARITLIPQTELERGGRQCAPAYGKWRQWSRLWACYRCVR